MDYESASTRTNDINQRTYVRNIPSSQLQPNLDSRPVSTKFTTLPVIDFRQKSNVPLNNYAIYNTEQTFNPGNNGAPWTGFASNINKESELKNQLFALQSCNQSVYVPKSSSNLYNYNWKNRDNNVELNKFPHLFEKEQFCPFNPNPDASKIGYSLFNNATRQQNKDLTDLN
jgi:hypothetical protein